MSQYRISLWERFQQVDPHRYKSKNNIKLARCKHYYPMALTDAQVAYLRAKLWENHDGGVVEAESMGCVTGRQVMWRHVKNKCSYASEQLKREARDQLRYVTRHNTASTSTVVPVIGPSTHKRRKFSGQCTTLDITTAPKRQRSILGRNARAHYGNARNGSTSCTLSDGEWMEGYLQIILPPPMLGLSVNNDMKLTFNGELLLGADVTMQEEPVLLRMFREPSKYIDVDANSIFQRALQYEEGSDGLPQDLAHAAWMYEHAIDNGGHVNSMFRLARLLKHGVNGVQRNIARAAWLFERAIYEGNHIVAMWHLPSLLHEGSDSMKRDIVRAASLHARAIHESDHEKSMLKLRALVERDSPNAGIDNSLNEEFEDVTMAKTFSMNNLGLLCDSDRQGKCRGSTSSVHELILVRRSALQATHNFTYDLVTGVNGIASNGPLAVSLYDRAIAEEKPRFVHVQPCKIA